jgi:hypothetical protein
MGWWGAQMVVGLPGKYKALSSNPSIAKVIKILMAILTHVKVYLVVVLACIFPDN